MSYITPRATMTQIAGSSIGQPSEKYDLTTGSIKGREPSRRRRIASAYSSQEAFGPGDVTGSTREQRPIMYEVTRSIPSICLLYTSPSPRDS